MSESSFNEQSKLQSIGKINQEYYQQIGQLMPQINQSENGENTVQYFSAFQLFADSQSCNIGELILLNGSVCIFNISGEYNFKYILNLL